ncbi:hypothetical protein DRF59_11180 [Chryseobacterium flavum]|uniref:Uncharacterized protein n=1 Tax=Chryseobacterium flavum TaxID=415851 RepID=A0A3D9CM90_9FLAO|nr:hypothetical protein [Chryseobacterium flavum]REC66863.1 hypothetical protein DRF59_11180 [Chryseobacterium flavum]
MEKDFISILLAGHEGFNFQDVCERYLIVKHGKDFVPVTPNGSEGDGGRDGYCFRTGEYFAISSNEKVSAKIKADFASCMSYDHPVSTFTFITNRGVRPKDCDVLDELRRNNPGIAVHVLRHSEIAVEMTGMSTEQIEYILGQPLPFQRNKMVYLKIRKKIGPFTLLESIKDSMHGYIIVVASCLILGFSLFYSTTDLVRTIFFTVIFGLTFLYMYCNRESLKKYKFSHKILYYLITGKLHVGDEVLLTSTSHITIYRNAMWSFIIHERAAECTRPGCKGHVLLHKSETGTFIGRCNKDRVNHLYNVDNNFYGEMK